MEHYGKHAVIDLDDTMSDFRNVIMESLNEMTGRNLHCDNWDKLDVEYLYGIPSDTFLKHTENMQWLEQARPHPETREFMYRMFDSGVETTILTARAWHPRAKEITRFWLGLYDIPYTNIKVCNLEDSKAEYIQNMENVLFTVDDSLRHCNNYAAIKKNRPEYVFAYAQAWNTKVDEGVIRINSLLDVANHIEGL